MLDVVVRATTVFAVSVVGVFGLVVVLLLGAFIAPAAGYLTGAVFSWMLPQTWAAFHQYAGLPAELGAGGVGALLGFVSLFVKSFTVN
jgi:hypothetical protein